MDDILSDICSGDFLATIFLLQKKRKNVCGILYRGIKNYWRI